MKMKNVGNISETLTESSVHSGCCIFFHHILNITHDALMMGQTQTDNDIDWRSASFEWDVSLYTRV